MSKLFGRAGHLLRLVDEKGLDDGGFDTLIESGLQTDLLEAAASGILDCVDRDKFRESIGLHPLELRFTVNRELTFEQRLAACGCDYNNPYITEENLEGDAGVLGTGSYDLVAELVHPKRTISTDGAEGIIVARDELYIPNPAESLAFGAAFPDLQRKFPIVLLGSVASIDGSRDVAVLGRRGSERRLFLFRRDYDWDEYCRFLAVRKNLKS